MREVRHRSAVPLYAAAAVWALWCLLLPLYKFWHFLLLIAASLIVGLVFSKLFPGTTELIETPPEPLTTGDEKRDALLREGDKALAEMKRLRSSIASPEIRSKIGEIEGLTERIFRDVAEDAEDYAQVKRFSDYYLPTTLKLLAAYERLERQGVEGENITGTMEKIDAILDTTVLAYKKQLDALFADQALDIDTDITVLEGMLKREGLSGRDFAPDEQKERNG